jgi:hypothetical protein
MPERIDLIDCDKVDGEYHWLFDNVRFVKPFPVKGKLHLFDVDTKLQYVESFADLVKLWVKEGLILNDKETINALIHIKNFAEILQE